MPHGRLTALKMNALQLGQHAEEEADADPLAIGLLLQRARRRSNASTSLMSIAKLRGLAKPLISENGAVAKRNRGKRLSQKLTRRA